MAPCNHTRIALKLGAALYVLHLLVHVTLWLINPVLGLVSTVLF
jgi:hypothetical protein